MVTNNGEPGGGVQIRIRGGTSISASNDPLYVIDGVPLQNEQTVAGAAEHRLQRGAAAQPAQLDQPERHRVDHGAEGRLGDGDLRKPRRQRRHPDPDQARRRAQRDGLDTTPTSAASTPAKAARFTRRRPVPHLRARSRSLGGLPRSQAARHSAPRTRIGRRRSRAPATRTNHNIAFSGGTQADELSRVAELLRPEGRRHRQRPQALSGSPQRAHTAVRRQDHLGANLTASRVNNDYLADRERRRLHGRRVHEHGDLQPDAAGPVIDTRDGPAEVLRDRRRRAGRAQPGRAGEADLRTRSRESRPRQRHGDAAPPRRPDGADDPRRRLHELGAPDVHSAHQPARR